MFSKTLTLLILLRISGISSDSLLPLSEIDGFVDFITKMFSDLDTMVVDEDNQVKQVKVDERVDGDKNVDKVIVKYDQVFQKINKFMERSAWSIEQNTLLQKTPIAAGIEANITQQVKEISEAFSRHKSNIENVGDNYSDFAKSLNNVRTNVQNLQKTVSDSGILVTIADFLINNEKNICGYSLAPDQEYYSLYIQLLILVFQGSSVVFSGHELLKRSDTDDFNVQDELQQLKCHISSYAGLVKNKASSIPRYMRNCDPEKLIRNENYLDFGALLSTVIITNFGFVYEHGCRGRCADKKEKWGPPPCEPNHEVTCRDVRQCMGKLKDCQVAGQLEVCFANATAFPRRYQWIKIKKGNYAEQKENWGRVEEPCYGQQAKLQEWGYSIVCEYCACICEESFAFKPDSTSLFSIEMQKSNTDENFVVTGIRFKNKENVLCVEIQEGKLIANGDIEKGSVKWREIRTGIFEEQYEPKLSGSGATVGRFELGDSFKLQTYEVPEGNIIVGAGLSYDTNQVGLTILYLPYDYETGKLDTSAEPSELKYPDFSEQFPTVELNPLVGYTPEKQSSVDSKDGQFINLGYTTRVSDAGQTTIPFLDSQNVEFQPPAPLAGINMYHRSTDNAGFVGLRAATIALKKHQLN